MTPPAGLPANILPETSGGSPQFYVDYSTGVDSAPTSGAIGSPWKTLTYAVNTRLATGGADDRVGQGAFINLRTSAEHGGDLALDTNWILGTSATTQNRGGAVTDPWTIRTATEDLSGGVTMVSGQPHVTNPSQGSGNQAKIGVRIDCYPSTQNIRWERIDFTASRISTNFNHIMVEGARYQNFFYCEVRDAPHNSVQFYRWKQDPIGNGCWGCLIHDCGGDSSGTPHDHGMYVGSGDSGDAVYVATDCWAVCNVIYKATGSGIQWYQKAMGMLVAHNTIDECSYPSGLNVRAGMFIGGQNPNYSRESVVVNTGLSTMPIGSAGSAAGLYLNEPGCPADGLKNLAHHNGFFLGTGTTNERSDASEGYPNAISYDGNNQTTDPLYTDRTGRDYRPTSSSPWKNAGDSSYLPATDFDGNAYVTADIGAFAIPSSGSVYEKTGLSIS